MIKDDKLKFPIDGGELGEIISEEDLEKAITIQLKAHGYTKEEIRKWFEEADEEE